MSWRGQWESHSTNPAPNLQHAAAAFEKAIELAPNFPWAHNDLALCWWHHGRYLDSQGLDPRPKFQLAMKQLKRVVALDPTYQFAYANLAVMLNDFANYCLERGLDFTALVEDVEQQVKTCGAGCATYTSFQRNMASVHLSQVQQQLRRGDDPRVALGRGRGYAATLLKLSSKSLSACMISSYADAFEAEYVLDSGGDPTALTETALTGLSRCQALDPQAEDPLVVQAWMYQARVTWARRHGGQPLPFAELALQAARRAVELGPESTDAAIEKTRACVRLAALSEPRAQVELLAEGLAAVDSGLKIRAGSGALLALRAIVLKEQSRLAVEPAAQASLLRESQVSWERALAINPLLAREYGPELQGR